MTIIGLFCEKLESIIIWMEVLLEQNRKVSSLGNAINPTFSKGESSEIISLTVPSTYIILIHEPKFFFLEQNLWTTSTLYYGMLRIPSTMVWDGQKFTYIVLRKLLLMSDQNLFVWMVNNGYGLLFKGLDCSWYGWIDLYWTGLFLIGLEFAW